MDICVGTKAFCTTTEEACVVFHDWKIAIEAFRCGSDEHWKKAHECAESDWDALRATIHNHAQAVKEEPHAPSKAPSLVPPPSEIRKCFAWWLPEYKANFSGIEAEEENEEEQKEKKKK